MTDSAGGNGKRPGLIRQPMVVPDNPSPSKTTEKVEKNQLKDEETKQESSSAKQININQQKNIKVSLETKERLDVLMKFANHKFTYELIESMVDVYVKHELDNDQKRAFKTLTNLIGK